MNADHSNPSLDERLKELGSYLQTIDRALCEPLGVEFEMWRNIWTGLVGAYLSLHKAGRGLTSAQRPFKITVETARTILREIGTGNIPQDQVGNPWWVGYWLNNAEIRIAAMLHQALKAGYECGGHNFYVGRLASGIFSASPCTWKEKNTPKCKAVPVKPQASNLIVMGIANEDENCELFVVHTWACGWKHEGIPDSDKIPPQDRWEKHIVALYQLSVLFLDFARQRKMAN